VWVKLTPHVGDWFAGEDLKKEEKQSLNHDDHNDGIYNICSVDEDSFVHDTEKSNTECDFD
jgi:hypothetical protein